MDGFTGQVYARYPLAPAGAQLAAGAYLVVGNQAVLDVLPVEPLPADSWHWDNPQVRVTAHCSNAGDGPPARGAARFVDNLRRYLAGEPLYNEASRSEVGL